MTIKKGLTSRKIWGQSPWKITDITVKKKDTKVNNINSFCPPKLYQLFSFVLTLNKSVSYSLRVTATNSWSLLFLPVQIPIFICTLLCLSVCLNSSIVRLSFLNSIILLFGLYLQSRRRSWKGNIPVPILTIFWWG